ncbi:MAG: SLC26A/SulP transporter family protein [Deltaproteobacteria bacterium]|nr:SLC26A/SulP transporter family protein [Candidatus Zymogenaceae bacterium]
MIHSSNALTFQRILTGIVGGIIIGFTLVFLEISFAALIFSGDLSPYLAQGIGYVLFGTCAVCLVIALISSRPGIIAISQDVPAAIFSVVGVAVVAAIPHDPESAFHTLVAVIIMTSLVSGVAFMAMGRFRLGRLVRYIPFPVVGGFLAGTGWLLASGAMGVMLGESLTFAIVPGLFRPDILLMWLPGTIFAFVVLISLRRIDHSLLVPGLIVGGVAVFYAALALTGTSIEEARSLRLLLGSMPGEGLWKLPTASFFRDVHWQVVLSQAGSIVAVLLVSVISLLFNTTGLELILKKDVDLNRELTAAGLANVVAGLGGGVVGYQTLSLSTLGSRLGPPTRILGITAALMCVVMMLFGASVLSYFPLPILGGLLMYLGLLFLTEWVYDAWFRLSKTDYLLVILILVAIAHFGFLKGVFAGLVVAALLFVVNYSKVEVAKHKLDGDSCRSPVDRSTIHQRCLDENVWMLFILKLQGFIFFGTADSLLNQVSARVDDQSQETPRFVILDFRHVSGFDASAVNSIMKMKQLAEKSGFMLVFTNLTDWMRDQLAIGGVVDETGDVVRVFSEFDYALEWCENEIIAMCLGDDGTEVSDIDVFLSRLDIDEMDIGVFLGYLERVTCRANDMVITQGAVADELYFIESGSLTVTLETEEGRSVRLRTVKSGNVVGEMGMYLGLSGDAYRSASVTANETSVLYRLTRESLGRMERKSPDLAAALHRFIITLLSTRLAQTNRMVETLMK